MAHENTYVVNEKDEIIGIDSKDSIMKQNKIYRATHVLIFNSEGKLLLQKRKGTKHLFPGYWECSASGTVEKGEGYEKNAYKELEEEMNISGVELKFLGKVFLSTDRNKEFTTVHVGHYDGPVKMQKSEVEDYKWVNIEEAEKMKITPGTQAAIDMYKEKEL